MNSISQKFVLFGAGKIGRQTGCTLTNHGFHFDYYVDNNPNIWGSTIYGKEVISPSKMQTMDCKICICTIYSDAVYTQLKDMGYSDTSISTLSDLDTFLCTEFIKRNKQVFQLEYPAVTNSDIIYIDIVNGDVWGGIEQWGYIVTKELLHRGYNVTLLANYALKPYLIDIEHHCLFIEYSYTGTDKWDAIIKLAHTLAQNPPHTVICNTMNIVFHASRMVKETISPSTKILSMILGDFDISYQGVAANDTFIDTVYGISKRICRLVNSKYGVAHNKIIYKEPFAPYDNNFIKAYSSQKKPLQLAVAGRLVVPQKRMDLILPMVEHLEVLGVHYEINVAGEGIYENDMKRFVKENNLCHKIQFLGFLNNEQRKDYWKDQDIYINLSDFEGTALTMLEAMSCGVVPVVTDVSGAEDFIDNGINGYTCNCSDPAAIAHAIKLLDDNRTNLSLFGSKCRIRIKERCNLQGYIDFIEDLSNGKNLDKYKNRI